jgi:uncharacterized damage-inducible protein DinB
MKPLLVDLSRHQSWADAEFWRAFERCAPAAHDDAIRNRLHHLDFVQRVFWWIVTGRDRSTLETTKPQDFASVAALRDYAEGSSRAVADFIEAATEERLSERVELPWFPKNPPFSLTVAEALMQAIMHSQWHRGQNAARLRELGGDPPLVDLIAWYLKDRPAADWSREALAPG